MSGSNRAGLFTPRQRRYLAGEIEDFDSASDERVLRMKIRDRIDTVFAEFELLGELDETDRQQIFEKRLFYDESDDKVKWGVKNTGELKRETERWEAGGTVGIHGGFLQLAEFFYVGYREQGYDPEAFIADIQSPIWQGEAQVRGVDFEQVNVELTGEVEVLSDDVDPVEKWKRGFVLTNEEIEEVHSQIREQATPTELAECDMGELVDKYLS